MHDVVGEIVLAIGDEDLLSGGDRRDFWGVAADFTLETEVWMNFFYSAISVPYLTGNVTVSAFQ